MKPRTMWIAVALASWLAAVTGPAMATAVWASGTGTCRVLFQSCYTLGSGGIGSTGLVISAISDTGAPILGGNALESAWVGYQSGKGFGVSSLADGELLEPAAGLARQRRQSRVHALQLRQRGHAEPGNAGVVAKRLGHLPFWRTKGAETRFCPAARTTYGGLSNGLVAKGWSVIGNYVDVCGPSGCGQSGGPASASANIVTNV